MLFHLVLAINTILSCFFKSSNFIGILNKEAKAEIETHQI